MRTWSSVIAARCSRSPSRRRTPSGRMSQNVSRSSPSRSSAGCRCPLLVIFAAFRLCLSHALSNLWSCHCWTLRCKQSLKSCRRHRRAPKWPAPACPAVVLSALLTMSLLWKSLASRIPTMPPAHASTENWSAISRSGSSPPTARRSVSAGRRGGKRFGRSFATLMSASACGTKRRRLSGRRPTSTRRCRRPTRQAPRGVTLRSVPAPSRLGERAGRAAGPGASGGR
mmetsp:Transcript_71880/g.164833  ORF Transcript_71880/g.164833 Transcript_71880/m.164833 type:complete len:227 (+) Transcript_71880:282-962(+)